MNVSSHKIIFSDARKLAKKIDKDSINLIVTSPPYPMIEMWDELFHKLNPKITKTLIDEQPDVAFELMHKELDKVYDQCLQVIKNDAIICINIGDATRTINGLFRLFTNGARTVQYFLNKGFTQLPSIIWHKPTNSPNKFMGSGMLPVGAYTTLEHEHILVFRKNKRLFQSDEDIKNRRSSAFFQYERNLWCQDIWKIIGNRQKNTNASRGRSAAYPLEIPYRLIALNSIEGDVILDPFGGTGTTTIACVALKRNSFLVEIERNFKNDIINRIKSSFAEIKEFNDRRLLKAMEHIEKRKSNNKSIKYLNEVLNIPVVTRQEQNLTIPILSDVVNINDHEISIIYQR